MQPVLHTARLHMKPVTLHDGDAFHLIWGDPEVIWWGHRPSVEATREFMKNVTAVSPLGRDDIGWWLLLDRVSGEVLGDAVLQPLAGLPMEIEVGWHLVRAHWGHGYATESAARLLIYALGHLRLGVIVAQIAFTNERSIAVAERLGMRMRPEPIDRSGIPHGVWEARQPLAG